MGGRFGMVAQEIIRVKCRSISLKGQLIATLRIDIMLVADKIVILTVGMIILVHSMMIYGGQIRRTWSSRPTATVIRPLGSEAAPRFVLRRPPMGTRQATRAASPIRRMAPSSVLL